MSTQTDVDPFAGGVKTPSLSFKDCPVGTTYKVRVEEPAKLLQGRDYDTDMPLFWDTNTRGKRTTVDTGQPVMAAVLNVTVLAGPKDVGERRAVWAQKPSSLFAALAEAQTSAKRRFTPGDVVTITHFQSEAHTDPKKADIKKYRAVLEQADAFAGGNDEPPF